MDPAAFAPSKELREELIDSVSRWINLWLEHEGEEFRHALEARLQRLVSNHPWLLDSLHPLLQDFILNKLQLDPPTATADLPGLPEDSLPSPPEDSQPDKMPPDQSASPSFRAKRRSRRHHPSLAKQALGVSESDCFVHTQPPSGQLTPAQAFYKALGIILIPPSLSSPQQEQPLQSCPISPSASPAALAPSPRWKRRPRGCQLPADSVSQERSVFFCSV